LPKVLIEQATREHGQCNRIKEDFIREEKALLSMEKEETEFEKMRVNRRQNMVVNECLCILKRM
jgi:hypothetical protein